MDSELKRETELFRSRRDTEAQGARQMAALRLACGLDLDEVLAARGDGRQRLAMRLRRIVERERLRGARGQIGYDLDRHIALKRVLDRLRSPAPNTTAEADGGKSRG